MKNDDFFGGIFDFNGDGKTDMGEEWIAFQIMNDVIKRNSGNISAGKTFRIPITTEPSKKQTFEPEKNSRSYKIGVAIAALVLLVPIFIFMWIAITLFDPENSVSVFLTVPSIIGGLFLVVMVIYSAERSLR